jgi:hypothetical protein
MEVISMDFILWLLIKFGEALVGVLFKKLIEWLLRDRNPNPPNQDENN